MQFKDQRQTQFLIYCNVDDGYVREKKDILLEKIIFITAIRKYNMHN